MILISRKVDYGILALHHLMIRSDGASARELSDQYGLSRAFVANILKQLCQEGFVVSQRGVNGGYRLAKPPAEITLEAVISALDGPFQLMACANEDTVPEGCEVSKVCPVRGPLRLIHERLRATLAETTLEDLRSVPADQVFVPIEMETAKDGFASDLSRQ